MIYVEQSILVDKQVGRSAGKKDFTYFIITPATLFWAKESDATANAVSWSNVENIQM